MVWQIIYCPQNLDTMLFASCREKPHIFFDDQMVHLDHLENIPAVHIPFGIANKRDLDVVGNK